MEGSHRKVVGTGMMKGELLCKVIQRVEVVARIEALLILAMCRTTIHLGQTQKRKER